MSHIERQRIGMVEPVFGNLRHNKQLNRFTLRGQHKVGTQWRLYCLRCTTSRNWPGVS